MKLKGELDSEGRLEEWKTHAHNAREIEQAEALAAELWDYLKRDPENKDRRRLAGGTKTKLGLLRTVRARIDEGEKSQTIYCSNARGAFYDAKAIERLDANCVKAEAQRDQFRDALNWIADKLRAEGRADAQDAIQIIWHVEAAIAKTQKEGAQ